MSDKTTIRRLPERAVDDREIVTAILDEGFVCHAAYVTGGRPVVIPTLYVRDRDRVLLHGSNSMGMARAVRAGSPLSIAITLVDGLVLARSAFNSSANYRSVVIHGMGRLLEGEEKVAAIITFGTLGAKAAVRDVGRASCGVMRTIKRRQDRPFETDRNRRGRSADGLGSHQPDQT